MLIDTHLEFNGFHGSPGKCHVRFCQLAKDKPLVIVCSQYQNYFGTSVTNAFETIVEDIFYLIANQKFSNVRFDFELPIIREWNGDVNIFDKVLAQLFPRKYLPRFTQQKLEIGKVFQRIVWIEHYSAADKLWGQERRYWKVKWNGTGNPARFGFSSEKSLIEETGYTSEELLIENFSLDLQKGNVKRRYEPVEVLQKHPGHQVIRWTEKLVASLLPMLSAQRSLMGKENKDDLDESVIQSEIERLFALFLPSNGLFERNYNFAQWGEIGQKGRPKNVDFAIFEPEGRGIDAILEVKRTSSKTRALGSAVRKDLARLLILSRQYQCSCYLLVCGNTQAINAELAIEDGLFSFVDNDKDRDKYFKIAPSHFDREYRTLLRKFDIERGATRLQGVKSDSCNSVVLWQVTADMTKLTTNRPYLCDIKTVAR